MFRTFLLHSLSKDTYHNWPIGKPLPSNADEPMAVEYQLLGDRNADIFRFQRHWETLEDTKLMVFMLYKW